MELLGKRSTIFDLDGYYKPLEQVQTLKYRHDNPEAADLQAAARDLEVLKRGMSVDVPVYSFDTHKQTGTRVIEWCEIIIVEGIFAFANEGIREIFDISIWIDSRDDIRLDRRYKRDTQMRGRSMEEVRNRYHKEAEPGYIEFLSQYRPLADISIINNGLEDMDEFASAQIIADHCLMTLERRKKVF